VSDAPQRELELEIGEIAANLQKLLLERGLLGRIDLLSLSLLFGLRHTSFLVAGGREKAMRVVADEAVRVMAPARADSSGACGWS
jgi:hypothetical protein